MQTIVHFFNSNFFIALVALIVGTFAIYIYKKQQRDSKRSAANTILLEIRNAERQIQSAKEKIGETRRNGVTQIPEHHYVMPMESWSKFKSLFVRDLKKDDWDRISKFYNDCQLFDETVAYSDAQFVNDTSEIRRNVHRAVYKYASTYSDAILAEKDETKRQALMKDVKDKKNMLAGMLTNAEYMYTYQPTKPIKDIEKLIDTIETKLSVDDAGRKLESISRGYWWW